MVSARKQLKVAKQTRNAARVAAVATVVGVRDQRKQMRAEQRQALAQPIAAPGWYLDTYDSRFIIWFDGRQWIPKSRRPANAIGR